MVDTLRRRGAQWFDDDDDSMLHRLKKHCREARDEIIKLEIAIDDTHEVFARTLAACLSACSNLIVTVEDFKASFRLGGYGASGDDESMGADDGQDRAPDLRSGDEDGMSEEDEDEYDEEDEEEEEEVVDGAEDA
jgi:hypothetical protein